MNSANPPSHSRLLRAGVALAGLALTTAVASAVVALLAWVALALMRAPRGRATATLALLLAVVVAAPPR